MSLIVKSNFSGTESKLFRGKLIVGLLKVNTWKEDGYGELDGSMLRFKTRGFWNSVTEIRDIEGTRVLGSIKYNLFKRTAEISYEEISYKWKFSHWMQQQWSVKREEDEASFKSTSFWKYEGELFNEGIPSAVLLASLFVHGHFRRMTAAS
ncbi:hypothetical protein [Dyadobacter sp.]|uniref:hypothetical protein n=1 Tax=Dyadobacter sp. TaxID=1914288 RepID=UPI003F70DCA7